MSATDELVDNSRAYAETFDKGGLPRPPAKRVAVLTCMDARVNPSGIFGLREGDAHILRNAGGAVTDDQLRSLAISQRLLGTTEIVLVYHTDCGMRTFTDAEFRRQLREETGVEPGWDVDDFVDIDGDLRRGIARVRACPFLPRRESVRGFVYDVADGSVREVT